MPNTLREKSAYLEELREYVRRESLIEGEWRGRLQGLRVAILRLGRRRFGRDPGARQKKRLYDVASTDEMERLVDRLLDATSWADLLTTA
jgi:hypothetical protein